MAFYLKPGESVEHGVKRIVAEQIDKALAELDDAALGPHDKVHQARKRCKKIRGVLRLVRPRFAGYADENRRFRDAARPLSALRDAEAMIETVDALGDAFKSQLDPQLLARVRAALAARRAKAAQDRAGLERRLAAFRRRMLEARRRVPGWTLSADEFDGVEPGLLKTYRRGRKAMAAAGKAPGAEAFHEWRKRAKYHRYHNRVLRKTWAPVVKAARDEAKALSDWLGDDHDLAVLRAALLASPREFGGKRDLQAMLGLIERRSAELRANAARLGPRLYAEKPKRLGARYRAYWDAWRREARAPAARLGRA